MGPLRTEPALTFGAIAALIVTLLGVFGIVLDKDTVEIVIAAAAPVLTAIFTRFFVTPVPPSA